MKKFTLRLTDTEAEALERLAYMHGVSQNRIIEVAIANMYASLDGDALVEWPTEKILRISVLLCNGVMNSRNSMKDETGVARLLRACSYDLAHDPCKEDAEYITRIQEDPETYLS